MKLEIFAEIGDDVTSTRSTNHKRDVMRERVFSPYHHALSQEDPVPSDVLRELSSQYEFDVGVFPEGDTSHEELLDNIEVFTRFMCGSRFADPDRKTNVSGKTVQRAAAQAFSLEEDRVNEIKKEQGKTSLGVAQAFDEGTDDSSSVQSTLGGSVVQESVSGRTISDVYRQVDLLPGAESDTRRLEILVEMFKECESAREAKWVSFCVLGDLSLYMGWKTVADGFSRALGLDSDDVKNNRQLSRGDLPTVVREYYETEQLRLKPEVGVPFKPMLASSGEWDEVPSDWMAQPKYDGARVLIHSDGEDVMVYSRDCKGVSESLVEIVENVEPEYPFIVDGEAVGYNPETDEPFPFEKTMTRFTRTENIEEARREVPIRLFVFDIVNFRGQNVHRFSFSDRQLSLDQWMNDCVPGAREDEWNGVSYMTNSVVSTTPTCRDVDMMWEGSLESGHEGLICRDPEGGFVFERTSELKKLKPDECVDLEIYDAERGSGENAQRLGRIYLRTADGVTLGRVGNGFSDEERERWDPVDGEEDLVGRIAEVEAEEIAITGDEEDESYGIRFPRLESIRAVGDGEADDLERCIDLLN